MPKNPSEDETYLCNKFSTYKKKKKIASAPEFIFKGMSIRKSMYLIYQHFKTKLCGVSVLALANVSYQGLVWCLQLCNKYPHNAIFKA